MNQPLNGSDICATRMRRAGNAIVAGAASGDCDTILYR
jgi:hypothetical protein